jgi:hypothetical protein
MNPTPKQQQYVDMFNDYNKSEGYSIVKLVDFTCFECFYSEDCPFAYNEYSTYGDCLADK